MHVSWYSLRGTGASQKMKATDNPKLVQADIGGDSEKVMMDHYITAEDRDRKPLAATMEDSLFSKISRKD